LGQHKPKQRFALRRASVMFVFASISQTGIGIILQGLTLSIAMQILGKHLGRTFGPTVKCR